MKSNASLFEIVSLAFIFIFIFYISLFLCKLFHVVINIREGQSLSYLFIYIQDRRGHLWALLDDEGINKLIIWTSKSGLFKFGWQECSPFIEGEDKKWQKASRWSGEILLSISTTWSYTLHSASLTSTFLLPIRFYHYVFPPLHLPSLHLLCHNPFSPQAHNVTQSFLQSRFSFVSLLYRHIFDWNGSILTASGLSLLSHKYLKM